MKNKEYKSLQNVESQKIALELFDVIRDSRKQEDVMVKTVGIFTLAFLAQRISENENMVNLIDASFKDKSTINFLKHLFNQYESEIEQYASQYDAETLRLIALSVESIVSRELGASIAEVTTPNGISKLAIELLDLKESDIILDLGSGVGSFLRLAEEVSQSNNLFGVELNTNTYIVSTLYKFLSKNSMETVLGNVVSQDFSYLSANKVFSNLPLGTKMRDHKRYIDQNSRLASFFKDAKRTVSGDWVFSIAAHLNTSQSGRTIVLMTNSGTWNKSDEKIRKKLVREGIIEGVILLPERLLERTGIPLAMVVMSQDNTSIKMVDASNIYTAERRQNFLTEQDIEKIVHAYYNETDVSRDVSVDEIAEQEYILNPQRCIASEFAIKDGKALGDFLVSVNRGATISRTELDELVSSGETEYRYLELKNIRDGMIDKDMVSLVDVDQRYEKYCIQDGDLIITRTGPFRVARANVKEEEKVLASGSLYFLRIDEDKINPTFLEIFLQSEIGMIQLDLWSKGNTIKMLSLQDLRNVQIPNIPREEQDKIAKEYESLNQELLVLERQADLINEKKAKLLEGVV